jgi:hypothetical protein
MRQRVMARWAWMRFSAPRWLSVRVCLATVDSPRGRVRRRAGGWLLSRLSDRIVPLGQRLGVEVEDRRMISLSGSS